MYCLQINYKLNTKEKLTYIKIAMEKTRLERLEMVLLSCNTWWFMKGKGRPKFQLSIKSLQNLHIFKLEKKNQA